MTAGSSLRWKLFTNMLRTSSFTILQRRWIDSSPDGCEDAGFEADFSGCGGWRRLCSRGGDRLEARWSVVDLGCVLPESLAGFKTQVGDLRLRDVLIVPAVRALTEAGKESDPSDGCERGATVLLEYVAGARVSSRTPTFRMSNTSGRYASRSESSRQFSLRPLRETKSSRPSRASRSACGVEWATARSLRSVRRSGRCFSPETRTRGVG